MEGLEILEEKRILAVDDEPDILESLEEVLYMCTVDSASDYETAFEFLTGDQKYDGAVLDIMGVNGYDLLRITTNKGIPTLMLTAHALNSDNFAKSIKGGANAYIPKDRLDNVDIFLAEIIRCGSGKKGIFGEWFAILKPFYDKKFGDGWLKKYQQYWE